MKKISTLAWSQAEYSTWLHIVLYQSLANALVLHPCIFFHIALTAVSIYNTYNHLTVQYRIHIICTIGIDCGIYVRSRVLTVAITCTAGTFFESKPAPLNNNSIFMK